MFFCTKHTRQYRKKNNGKMNGAAPFSLTMGALTYEVLILCFGIVLIVEKYVRR